ncbi:hypothetical protein GCM10011331_10980 [Flavimobilis marinus]|uniref:Uncharacterized protein n=1 Tax=Flavimobilis marinus TaxID=285351 RepID=A0A1I2HT67_9MICO|nr:DLW-39 family protein [Flavimobilis marinus]GHG48879.1 hypothetical protein GCM10011331_10980 [Flavimobilis marinus]SFF32633.1 hypothetical protein SAMN04488035_2486 [Flavimobilis marinus]
MKRLILAVLAAVAGSLLWRRFSQHAADRQLWADVTDSFE